MVNVAMTNLGSHITLHSVGHIDWSSFIVGRDSTRAWISGGKDHGEPDIGDWLPHVLFYVSFPSNW